MEAAKPARAETRVQSQVRDWLQYGEELGLGPYYRDRHAVEVAGSDSELTLEQPVEIERAPAENRLVEVSPEVDQTTPMPPAKILKAAAASLISSDHAAKLFDEHRIEGDTLGLIRDQIQRMVPEQHLAH